jgi:hypothetical protein
MPRIKSRPPAAISAETPAPLETEPPKERRERSFLPIAAYQSTAAVKTAEAAYYLTRRYRPTSVSLLRKMRLRKRGDPLELGPRWERGPDGACYYRISALDEWSQEWLRRLTPLKDQRQREHLRIDTPCGPAKS